MYKFAIALFMTGLSMIPMDVMANRQQMSLEKYELNQLRIWHVFPDKCGGYYADVVDPEGYIHRLDVGAYIGKKDGKAVRIDLKGVDLVELYPDGQGGWKEVPARLENPSYEDDKDEVASPVEEKK